MIKHVKLSNFSNVYICYLSLNRYNYFEMLLLFSLNFARCGDKAILHVNKDKAISPHVGPGPVRGVSSVGGIFKGSYSIFMRVSGKTTEISERLGRQPRRGLSPKPPVYQLEHRTAQNLVRLFARCIFTLFFY